MSLNPTIISPYIPTAACEPRSIQNLNQTCIQRQSCGSSQDFRAARRSDFRSCPLSPRFPRSARAPTLSRGSRPGIVNLQWEPAMQSAALRLPALKSSNPPICVYQSPSAARDKKAPWPCNRYICPNRGEGGSVRPAAACWSWETETGARDPGHVRDASS